MPDYDLSWWLDALKRARNGSDKSWLHECKTMVAILRAEICAELAKEAKSEGASQPEKQDN